MTDEAKKLSEEKITVGNTLTSLIEELSVGLQKLSKLYPGMGYALVLTGELSDGSYISGAGTNLTDDAAVDIFTEIADALRVKLH